MPYVVTGQFEQLPEWYKAILRSFVEQSEALRKQPYPEYQGPRVAALPPYVKKSYELAKNLAKTHPGYDKASKLLEPSKIPYKERLKEYESPYLQNVIEQIGKQGKRILEEEIMPSLEAKFVNLGQHGSSRHKDLSLRAARDLEKAILEKQTEALERGFERSAGIHEQEEMRKLHGARTLGDLANLESSAEIQNINLINALGAQEQAHRQQELNEQQSEFWRKMMWPHQILQQQASVIQGIPSPGGGQTAMQYIPPTPIPQLNPLGQIGSMASQLYGLGQIPRGGFKKGGHIKKYLPLSSLKFFKKKSKKGII